MTIKTIFTQKVKLTTPFILASLLQANFAFAEDDSLWDMSLEELGQIRVTTLASGTATPLDKAAAVATVITEEDIIAMGATDLDQVLETVPGVHIGKSPVAFTPKYNIRGITSQYTAQTLVLINGTPITDLVFGNRSNVWAGMPVKSISRIEIIRGPGSAMYGADAFAGVINIITKGRKDINGTLGGVRKGSFDTKASWIEHGGSYEGFNIGFTLEYETTDGWKEIVTRDAQSGYDDDFMTNASLAPGSVNTMKEMLDARIDIEYENSRLRIGYQGRSNIGTGPGLAQALDPNGRFGSDRINADYTYTLQDLGPDWGMEGRISYFHNTQEAEENAWIFPPGAFGGAYQEGFIGNPGYKVDSARVNINSVFRGLDKHLIRFGTGGFWGDVYQTTETKNFNPDFSPRAGIEDVSDTAEVYLPEEDRTTYHAFIQDEWQFSDNWQLTSGVRYDHYSDFGSTTNPRLALVWATTDSITTKLLYGKAFRAPSISELHVTSNPVALGDINLKPEKIDTYELALSQQVSSSFRYTSNIYYYEIKDFISFETFDTNTPGNKRAENSGERTGYGFEVEANYKTSNSLRIVTNYAYQKSEDDKTNTDVGEAPNHQLYLRTEWKPKDNWLISPQINWVGKQKRSNSDARTKALASYTTVDLTIRQKNIVDNLDISLSVHNFFDRSVFEPSEAEGLVNDFPMAGRSIYGEIAYTF
ncbi:MAG: outer membrane receptor for ferrienterochelin and colicin [Oleiphilaceae bacterium]